MRWTAAHPLAFVLFAFVLKICEFIQCIMQVIYCFSDIIIDRLEGMLDGET